MKALVFLCKKSWVLREKYAKKLAAQPVQNEYESEVEVQVGYEVGDEDEVEVGDEVEVEV